MRNRPIKYLVYYKKKLSEVLFMDREKSDKPGDDKDRVRETPVTYDDYAAMPDDGQRYEIDDGVLQAMSPAPSPRHQEVGLEIYSILKASCESEYWIIDPVYGSLDQYVLSGSTYELINVYSGDEPVRSDRVMCVNFTMNEVMRWAKDLPD
jgi:Uma2 family endonuclease